ncbi:hypothetical protein B7494_g405 [Chlorociboria aeruginascens]|nr:hypothetical protein B7494_g405 [Chlorociboria aeruginascens]
MMALKFVKLGLAPYIFVIPIIVISILTIVGCVSTSPGIPGIFIMELGHQENVVRFGYLGTSPFSKPLFKERLITTPGLCSNSTSNSTQGLTCLPTLGQNATLLAGQLSAPVDLTTYALSLQSSISWFMPSFGGLLFFVGLLTLLGAQHFSKLNNARAARLRGIFIRITPILLWVSVAVTLAGAYSLSQILAAMKDMETLDAEGEWVIKTGRALQVLQWMTFAFLLLFTGLAQMVLMRGGNGWNGGEKAGDA